MVLKPFNNVFFGFLILTSIGYGVADAIIRGHPNSHRTVVQKIDTRGGQEDYIKNHTTF